MPTPANLTESEIAEYEKAAGPATPAAINPLRDFSSDELFDLAIKDKENFDLVGEFRRNKDLWKDPTTVQKVAEVHSRIKDRGFELEDIPGPGKIARTVFDIAKGFGKQAWNYANALVGVPIASVMGEVSGQGPGFETELAQEGQRRIMENLAGTEAGAFGVARLAEKGIGKVRRLFSDMTPEEKAKDFWDDIGRSEQEEEILKGKGGLLEPVGGEVRRELEAAGKPIRPEETSQLAAGDPLSFYTFGKIFQGAGKLVPARVATGVEKAATVAGKAAEVAGGRAIQAAGTLTALGGRAIKVAAPAVGMIKGAIEAGPVGALAGLKGGEIAAKVGGKISKGGKAIAEMGKEIAGAAPVTGGVTQLAKDVIGGVPVAATEIGKGLAFDIGTAALTSEAPRDTESVGIGAFFGGLGAARRVGSRVISGQLVGPRAWGSDKVIYSSGKHPVLDTMHSEATRDATPAVKTRLNAIRQFLKGSHADTDVFLAKDAKAVENAMLQSGASPEQARQFSQTEGFFVTSLPDANGNPQRVIIARNVDAAPHESFHAIQDVLGETANQAIDQIVREEYGSRWEVEGQRYASRIGEGDWREVILDSTGTGLNYAKEKIAMDVANEYRAVTGAEPPSKYVQDRSKEIFGQAMDRAVQSNPQVNPNEIARRVWRDILSPEEATAVADSYLARELAAENFDMVFKHGGPDLQNVSGLTGRLARIVAQLVSTLGGEPLSPERPSQIGEVAPRFRVTEAVRSAPDMVQPREAATSKPQIVLPSGKPSTPTTPPSESSTVDEARKIAAEAPETSTTAGTASPREILGNVAEAIAQNAGLKVNYLSAVGEGPAAAITSNREARRAVIEAFRTMPPEARALWEKNFFPDRVVKLKGNKYQILGWAPEVFASNAHKLAAKLQELGVADASPYPIREGTFTPEGWQELFRDVQTFVQNQMSGRTGAGEPLVIPRQITERGFFAPPVRGRAEALPQLKADFINMLFGIKLPDTARIQKGKLPLNLAGQAVSEATQPGRTEIPVIPRGKFEGAEAERQGIAGQEIKEVNPLRQQIEAAAQAKGVAMPEFIEAQQRLNLENIKNVEVAPELPQFRGNILTLTAGFQPKTAGEKPKPLEIIFRPGWLSPKGEFFSLEDFPTHDHWAVANIDSLPGIRVPNNWTGTSIELLQRNGWMRFTPFRKDSAIIDSGSSRKSPTKEQRNALEDWAINDPDLKKVYLDRTQEGIGGAEQPEILWSREGDPSTFQFQPSAEPRAVKSAAVKDERGKVWEGFWHGDAEESARIAGRRGPFSDGFTTNNGEFLTREEALVRAKETKQVPESAKPGALDERNIPGLETGQLFFGEGARFQPEQQAKNIAAMSAKEFRTWAEGLSKKGGFTEVAHKMGLDAPSQEFVDTLIIAQKAFSAKAEEAMKAGDFEKAMILASQSQFFREAWEAATGEGSAGYFFRKERPGYQPKFPLDKVAKTVDTATQMQPKKELKLKPAGRDGVSKAWVLPNGKVVNIGGQWHHEYLNENPELRKQYGLSDDTSQDNREGALKKGFARINWSYGNGHLTIEARTKDWPRQREAVRNFVEANSDKIDRMQVVLLSDNLKKVDDANEVSVFTLEDNEKAAMLPFGDLGDKRATGQASERLFEKAASKAQLQPRRDDKEIFVGDLDAIDGSLHLQSVSRSKAYRGHEDFDMPGDNPFRYSKGVLYLWHDLPVNVSTQIKRLLEAEGHLVKRTVVMDNLTQDAYERAYREMHGGKNREEVEDALDQGDLTGKFQPTAVKDVAEDYAKKAAMLPFSDLGEKRETGQASERLFERAVSKAQFQPPKDPKKEFIKAAAIRAEDGEIFTGDTHFEIRDYRMEEPGDIAGFVTNTDRFVDRDEAYRIARKQNQLPSGPTKGSLAAEDIDELAFPEDARRFQPKSLKSELEKVRKGETFGQTFTSTGEVWEPKPADIVTLASVTVPTKDLTPEKFSEVTDQYKELLSDPNVVTGVFSLDKDRISIDINAVVPQEFREQTVAFAKANDQVSIWDAGKMEEVKTGGTGETKIKTIDQMRDALEQLQSGEGVDVEGILGVEKEPGLFGPMEKKMTPREISKLPPSRLRKIYPEAVVTKDPFEPVPSKIVESPLYKRAGSEEAAVKAFGDKLAEFARSKKDDPIAKAGAEWYDKFTPMLRKEFGKDAQLFAELLAATSPSTTVETNFQFALDALDSFKSGRFKKIIDKFNQGLEMIAEDRWKQWYNKELKNIPNPPQKPTAATFLEHWIYKHDLKPRQTNGKLYGIHSLPVLQVFARRWLTDARGPKTLNFIENLMGQSYEATIDIWADRTMRRIGYEGQERWRVLPKNAVPVSDKDFAFSQKAFRYAAEQLGMKPSALQGMLWFAEKQLWADKGWSDLNLGDFQKEMEKIPELRRKRLTLNPEKSKLQRKLL